MTTGRKTAHRIIVTGRLRRYTAAKAKA